MFRRTLQSAIVTLAIGSSALAAELTGSYSAQTPQGTFQLTLQQDAGKLSGTVHLGGDFVQIVGEQSGDRVLGYWAAQGRSIPFSASTDGTHLKLSTNGVTYDFQKSGTTTADQTIDQLAAVMKPAAGVADTVHWNDVNFPENAGSISVPDGWQIVGAETGFPGVFGPRGEIVALGQRLNYSTRQLPYRGPVDAAKTIWTQFSGTFNPPVKVVQIIDAREGGDSADIRFVADVGQGGTTQRMTGHMILQCSPPDARGNWKGIYSAMLAPQDSFEADEPLMTRVWNSWQLNSRQVYANAQQQAVGELSRFRGQLAANAAQFANTSHTYDFTGGAVADAEKRMRGMARQGEDFSNAAFGNNMAVNNQTGRVFSTGVNNAADLNAATHSQDFSTFHVTPDP